MPELPIDDARALVGAVVQLASMADRVLPRSSSPLTTRLRAHLGLDGETIPNTSIAIPLHERGNVQLALNAYATDASTWDVVGLSSDIGHYSGVSLPAIADGTWRGPGEAARQYEAVEIDVETTIPCLRSGIVLTEHDGVPVALLLYQGMRFPPQLELEVVARAQATAEAFLRRLRELIDEHNAFRGKIITFQYSVDGEPRISFTRPPTVARDDVVLREGDLGAVEEHTIGISTHADALRAAGQHVKRGLLLYGPPGTGKTHTISYLLGRMQGRTSIILSGSAVRAVGQAGAIARHLQPATIVIEDVDLIGLDRELPGAEHAPLLFQLLNEMDGLSGDADVLFILTTNRVEILEPALAARPGRVDQAIELSLPDASARRRLLELYSGAVVDDDDGEELIRRTEGVAPAFIKELARRATIIQLRSAAGSVRALHEALDAMLEHATPILRATLAGSTAGDVDGDAER